MFAAIIRQLLACLLLSQAWADVLYYPRSPAGENPQASFPLLLLRLALEKAGANYTLQPAAVLMPQGRLLLELQAGRSIDIAWAVTNNQREAQLLPVRIPITKGLNSWRIPLVHSARRDLLRNVRSLADLQKLVAGQGHDWPDTAILRANGLPVEGVSNYDGLFKMLIADRFDYFPRAATEILGEMANQSDNAIVIDPYIAIYYPAPTYYFFNRRNGILADTVERGLERALADGSFDALFQQHFGKQIKTLQLHRRTVIRLQNPDLPPVTPLARKVLWFDPTNNKRP